MISRDLCQRVLQRAMATGGDYAEIFSENTLNHSINMIADRVETINDSVVAGAAVRVYKGFRSVMATTIDTSEEGLLRCAEKAADALGEGTAEIEVEFFLNIVPAAYENGILKLEIEPDVKVTYKDESGAQIGDPLAGLRPKSLAAPLGCQILKIEMCSEIIR